MGHLLQVPICLSLILSGALGATDCIQSLSIVNGNSVCKNQIIFQENFFSEVPLEKWTPEIFIPGSPDYPFVYFDYKKENIFVDDGRLKFNLTVLEDSEVRTGSLNLAGCTGSDFVTQCQKSALSYNILPPVRSARISTKDTFSFKYGTITVRAKLPLGDWIIPEIWLEPKRKFYGVNPLVSGRIRLAMARGNEFLKMGKDEIGNSALEAGIIMSDTVNNKARTVIRVKDSGWYNEFHDYTLIWTPEQMTFKVDDVAVDLLPGDTEKIYQLLGFTDGTAWEKGSSMAPFDQEFYISLGLSVGGMLEFPDDSISGNGRVKPWKNNVIKAMAYFWQDRDQWQRTWGEDSMLQIERIKVKSL